MHETKWEDEIVGMKMAHPKVVMRGHAWPCKGGAPEFMGWQKVRDEVLDSRWWIILIWNHIAFMHGLVI